MIKVKYFKNPMWGDCYIADDYSGAISISKTNCSIITDEERIFNGAYKEIKITKIRFKKMMKHAKENERKELTNLLKMVHKNNQNHLNNLENPYIRVKTNFLDGIIKLNQATYLRSYFFNAKPILE